MKRVLIAGFGLLAASSLLAGTDTAQQTTTAATTTATAAAKPAATEDSPLVKAAKSAHKPAKKHIVITDEDVKHSSGHISTTRTLPPVYSPKLQTEEATQAEIDAATRNAAEKKKAIEAKAKADQEKKEHATRMLNEYQEDDLFSDDDPARAEHRQEQAAKALQDQQKQQQDATKKQ